MWTSGTFKYRTPRSVEISGETKCTLFISCSCTDWNCVRSMFNNEIFYLLSISDSLTLFSKRRSWNRRIFFPVVLQTSLKLHCWWPDGVSVFYGIVHSRFTTPSFSPSFVKKKKSLIICYFTSDLCFINTKLASERANIPVGRSKFKNANFFLQFYFTGHCVQQYTLVKPTFLFRNHKHN